MRTASTTDSFSAGTVQAFVNERLGGFLEQNPPIAKRIINKAIEAARAREAAHAIAKPALQMNLATVVRDTHLQKVAIQQRVVPDVHSGTFID